ncbi:MAG: hypothetical protein MJZ11_01550 [Lachnospiraceae bacterium]|nr:hypothetical protein [Lachnospiraceae bacterium]
MNEDEIIRMLDSLTQNEISRIKINVADDDSEQLNIEHHHGRCDIGSPFARGCAFDVLE